MDICNVIVPSKGRPDGTTFAALIKERIPFIVVIEPQDVASYREVLGTAVCKYWVLPHNNKGIGYSRWYILTHARKPFVMLDDDITRVYRPYRNGGSVHGTSLGTMLSSGWSEFSRINQVCVYGYKHTTFGLPSTRYTYNTTLAHIVFMNPVKMRNAGIAYDPDMKAFEDIDLIFQCFKKNVLVIRSNHYIYYTTPSGTSTHGGIDYGKDGVVKRRALRVMTKRYPSWIRDTRERTIHNQPRYEIMWKPPKPSTIITSTSR